MKKWIFTGVSGSGRIELLEEIKEEAASRGFEVQVYDVGDLIRQEAIRNQIPIIDELILDMDRSQLRLLRSSALKNVELEISKSPEGVLHLIGVHATFKWKGRLIPGIAFQDIVSMHPDGFVNVVRNLDDVYETNRLNTKWDENTLPDLTETQDWIIIEEFVTEVLAEVSQRKMYLVARDHNITNLADLFLTDKKKLYLSYPITAVEKENPDLLERIHNEILPRLEELFVVFNPMSVEDMPLTSAEIGEEMPELVEQLTPRAKEIIKSRTIDRDFQLIDQADAVVVLYMTDKVSPGVLAEIYYAHRNMTPVFVVFPYRKSPFMEDAVTHFEDDLETMLTVLQEFASV
jgi:adenylate kinase